MNPRSKQQRAFTLIELSIVLVVIGLLVGGVLVGRDLINASAVRSQTSQIERYQSAVNTFRGKYNNYLPGDIPNPDATNFGFSSRGTLQGEGDGNYLIEGRGSGTASGQAYDWGETNMVWVDLSTAKMIDGKFNLATATTSVGSVWPIDYPKYMPEAKIKQGSFVYVYSRNSINHFAISGIDTWSIADGLYTTRNLTPAQAYSIDKKMDDGQPGTGSVLAQYINAGVIQWVNEYPYAYGTGAPMPLVNPLVPASPSSCIDNGNVTRGAWAYSVTYNNGNSANCALSFKFQ